MTQLVDTYRRHNMEINATIIVQLVVFLSLMLWLSKVLFAPLMKLFDARELRIQGSKDAAKELEAQGLEKLAYVEARMKQAQKESREMFAVLKAEGAAYHRTLVDDARSKARSKMTEAKIRIATDLEKARSQMSPFIEENVKLLLIKFLSPESLSNTKQTGSSKMEFRGA